MPWGVNILQKVGVGEVGFWGGGGGVENQELYLVVLLFYVHGKHLRSCRDGQLT